MRSIVSPLVCGSCEAHGRSQPTASLTLPMESSECGGVSNGQELAETGSVTVRVPTPPSATDISERAHGLRLCALLFGFWEFRKPSSNHSRPVSSWTWCLCEAAPDQRARITAYGHSM